MGVSEGLALRAEPMTLPLASDIAERVQLIASLVPELSELSAAITAVIADHDADWDVPITESVQTDLLKAFTGSVVRLGVDLACYPLGYVTEALFDEDGNPV